MEIRWKRRHPLILSLAGAFVLMVFGPACGPSARIDPDLVSTPTPLPVEVPANSTFTATTPIAIGEIDSDLCGLFSFECFPQPGTTVGLDPLREVVMWRLQYRNFGTHETLVGNLVTDVDGTNHGGIRWFELRKSGGGPWSLHQEGTHAPDQAHRWMGSVAMDVDGNMQLGYSVSDDTSIFPSILSAGRLAGDPLGTLPQGRRHRGNWRRIPASIYSLGRLQLDERGPC